MGDDFDLYDSIDYPTREEEKAAEIALDVADEQRRFEEEQANLRLGQAEMCEGCHGTGSGYEDEAWDDEGGDVVLIDYEHCPERGGCGYDDRGRGRRA